MSATTLVTLSYYENKGRPLEWSISDLQLGQINLIVGKNATGKSRVLNVITSLANQLLSEKLTVTQLNFEATFQSSDGQLKYILRAENQKVIEEKVYLDGELKLDRNENVLKLFYDKEQKNIEHQPSDSEVSAAARKDVYQHPYLSCLNSWARAVRHYHFGAQLGKDCLALRIGPGVKGPELDDRDESRVVGIFLKAKKEFGSKYVDALLKDMHDLGYPLSEVSTAVPSHIEATMVLPSNVQLQGELNAIGVVESGVEGMFFQDSMSQGMFRALSILIQVNYSQLSKRANCIIIDDIGEGLDFERSTLLISKLRQKAKSSAFQLIMSTNDQYVMNHVPLDEWSVLQRKGMAVTVKNIYNSKQIFEDFRFVGMSNFSFFEMDFAGDVNHDENQRDLNLVSPDE